MGLLALRNHFPSLALRRRNGETARHTNPQFRRLRSGTAAMAFCLFAGLLFTPLVRITPENCARIEPAMTEQQVEAILGGPPDRYDAVASAEYTGSGRPGKTGAGERTWSASQGAVAVFFDDKDCVRSVEFYPLRALAYEPWRFVVERLTRCTFSRWEWWWSRG